VKYVHDWYTLGITLGISTQSLEKLSSKYGHDKNLIKKKLIYLWFRTSQETSKSVLNAAISTAGKKIRTIVSN